MKSDVINSLIFGRASEENTQIFVDIFTSFALDPERLTILDPEGCSYALLELVLQIQDHDLKLSYINLLCGGQKGLVLHPDYTTKHTGILEVHFRLP